MDTECVVPVGAGVTKGSYIPGVSHHSGWQRGQMVTGGQAQTLYPMPQKSDATLGRVGGNPQGDRD